MNLDFFVHAFNLLNASEFHSILPESLLSSISDICDFFHGLNGFDVKVSIVLHWLMTFFFEFEDRIVGELFSMELSVGFGPGKFSRIMFGLEMFMALSTTELEHFAIVTDKGHTVTGIDRARAKVTLFNTHFNNDILAILII
jgi:hypothetical protein